MSERTFGRTKAGTSTFSNPSLVSPHTPTLANPTRGFGLPTNNHIQTATKESTNLQEAETAGEESLLSEVIEQRSFGHDISRIALRRPQAKLTVGEPGDKYEQEADWMANQVMRMVVPDQLNAPNVQSRKDFLQRKCTACAEEDKVQTKPSIESATDGGLEIGNSIESRLNRSKGGGSALPDEVRGFMEPRFGADFSSVRVHTGSDAAQMNRELQAQAFTHGSDVYYGAGKSVGNNELTAHELTHVVQQTQPLQRKCAASPEEDKLMRQEEESSSSTSSVSNASEFANTTDRLLDLITRLEQLHTHSNQQIGLQGNEDSADKTDLDKEGEEHLDTLSSGLNQLRAVAASNDEALKQRVLAAFAPSAMQTAQAEASSRIQAASGASTQASSPEVVQETPANIATKSLTISSQQDAAEIEADEVAKAVTFDQSVTVNQRSPEANISRLAGGETLIALGVGLLAADAEAAPLEVVAGPPGWAIGLGIAAVAVVAIGIGYAISDSSTDSQPVTNPAPAPAPGTTAPPIPVPVPLPKTRKFPNQTCEDDRMAILEGIMHGICDQGFSCSDGTEKLGRKKEKLLSREELLENIARAKACIKARQDIQDECFKGSTDPAHAKVIAEIEQALKTCEQKYIARHGALP
jgi:hypothetical protein